MITGNEAPLTNLLPTQGASEIASVVEIQADESVWRESVLKAFERKKRFDFAPLVQRYAKEYGLNQEESQEHIDEMCRFLCLAGSTRSSYSMMGPVDHAWHTFILFTKMYSDFCNEIAGKYIHHNPGEILTGTRDSYVGGYNNLLADYERAFGTNPPPHIWPQITATAADDISCISCNCETCSPYVPPCD